MSADVASNASNLLMDIKPGYMLGAKPRQQRSHVIGIVQARSPRRRCSSSVRADHSSTRRPASR